MQVHHDLIKLCGQTLVGMPWELEVWCGKQDDVKDLKALEVLNRWKFWEQDEQNDLKAMKILKSWNKIRLKFWGVISVSHWEELEAEGDPEEGVLEPILNFICL